MRILAISLNWNCIPKIATQRAETASELPNASDSASSAKFTR